MTTTDHPLAALAKPPPGTDSAIDTVAIYATSGDVRAARVVVAAVEPSIVEQAVRRILRDSTAITEWATRYHYTDGRNPNVYEPMGKMSAKLAADGLNQDETAGHRERESADWGEVVCREVRQLRDGSTLIGPWGTPDEQAVSR